MEEEHDEFAGSTGLKDDYDGTIVDPWFATSSEVQDGKVTLAYLKVAADDGEEVELRYTCGPDWASFDGGETVEHPRGPKQAFNNKTAYFDFFSHALQCEGAEQYLRNKSREELNGLGPKAAALWKDTRWHFEVKTEKVNFRSREGEQIEREVSRTIPTRFLGTAEGAQVSASAGAGVSAPSAPADAADPLASLSAEDQAKARAAAKAKDFGAWVDYMLTLPGAVDDATLVQALGDEGGLYARLRSD